RAQSAAAGNALLRLEPALPAGVRRQCPQRRADAHLPAARRLLPDTQDQRGAWLGCGGDDRLWAIHRDEVRPARAYSALLRAGDLDRAGTWRVVARDVGRRGVAWRAARRDDPAGARAVLGGAADHQRAALLASRAATG